MKIRYVAFLLEHLRHYLVQDYQFVDRFVALLGAAIASADQYAARVRFSQFAAMITSDENTYFQRCFDLLREIGRAHV